MKKYLIEEPNKYSSIPIIDLKRCKKCTILIQGEFISNKSKIDMLLCNQCDNSPVKYDKYGIPTIIAKVSMKQLSSKPKYE